MVNYCVLSQYTFIHVWVQDGGQRLGFLFSFFEVRFFIIPQLCVNRHELHPHYLWKTPSLLWSSHTHTHCFSCLYFWPLLTSRFPLGAKFIYQVNLSILTCAICKHAYVECFAFMSLVHETSIISLKLFLIRH